MDGMPVVVDLCVVVSFSVEKVGIVKMVPV